MKYHDLPVLGQLHIQFDPAAVVRGTCKCRQRIFRDSVSKCAAMGVIDEHRVRIYGSLSRSEQNENI